MESQRFDLCVFYGTKTCKQLFLLWKILYYQNGDNRAIWHSFWQHFGAATHPPPIKTVTNTATDEELKILRKDRSGRSDIHPIKYPICVYYVWSENDVDRSVFIRHYEPHSMRESHGVLRVYNKLLKIDLEHLNVTVFFWPYIYVLGFTHYQRWRGAYGSTIHSLSLIG